jgi:hypothetical protein
MAADWTDLLNTNLMAENLKSLTRETIDTMTPKEAEDQDRPGKWYSVLTLMDIGAVKRFQEQIERLHSHLLETVELMQEPVLVLNEELQAAAASTRYWAVLTFGGAHAQTRS